MTFVSYAQNFEDVMLNRVFKDLATGFYIDVGAGHPDIDSVTRAFYDAGWRGINIEPCSEFYDRLQAARDRDVNLNVAVGETTGKLPFFQISDTGLSTMEPEIAAEHRAAGLPVAEVTVEQITLAEICRLYAQSEIHFLKIDVEGAEYRVLAGADFVSYRPWVVIVEATKPRTQVENYHDWEPILLSADYQFVWFDGLNRFYVANERALALRQYYTLPPNFFDNFRRASDNLTVHYITVARLRTAEAERQAAEAERRSLEAEARTVAAERRQLEAEALAAQDRMARQTTDAQLKAIHRSASWRITAPLRTISDVARLVSFVRRLGPIPSSTSGEIETDMMPPEARRPYEILRRRWRIENDF